MWIADLGHPHMQCVQRLEGQLEGHQRKLKGSCCIETQIGVTTNGKGCRLAGRIKRELVSMLPREARAAVEKIGKLRSLAKPANIVEDAIDENELNDEITVLSPNRPDPQRSDSETALEHTRRRMKWVAQISEYWSITRLAKLTEADMNDILNPRPSPRSSTSTVTNRSSFNHELPDQSQSQHGILLEPPLREGRIYLVGSGPGHPSLLTIATHMVLTKHADLVLTDKLVPAAVLALIPKHVEVRVARKFPGNAEQAQLEMMEAAVEAAEKGRIVVRVSHPEK